MFLIRRIDGLNTYINIGAWLLQYRFYKKPVLKVLTKLFFNINEICSL